MPWPGVDDGDSLKLVPSGAHIIFFFPFTLQSQEGCMKLAATANRPVGSIAEAEFITLLAQAYALLGVSHALAVPSTLNISRLLTIVSAFKGEPFPWTPDNSVKTEPQNSLTIWELTVLPI